MYLQILKLALCTLMTLLVTRFMRGVSSTSSHFLTRSERTEALNLLKFSSHILRVLRTLVYAQYKESANSEDQSTLIPSINKQIYHKTYQFGGTLSSCNS